MAWVAGFVLAAFLTAILLLAAYVVGRRYGLDSLLRRQARTLVGRVEWEDHGPTPLGERRFTPQGLTWVDGRLLFANSWQDTRSRIYEIDPGSMEVRRTFDMPDEAVHTSGLAWDGTRLWAVDYRSNRAYWIDLEASFAQGRAEVVGEFDTTLRGTSACCLVPWQGERLLAISDFMRSRRTIFVRTAPALAAGSAAGQIVFAYTNDGLSQGLEYAEGYLFEAENKWGVDVINMLSLERLATNPQSYAATVRQFPAPARGVEDLAWDGEQMWTSDESIFRFFRGNLDRGGLDRGGLDRSDLTGEDD